MLDSALLSTMDVVVKIQVYVEACPRLSCVLSSHGIGAHDIEEGSPSRGGLVFGELDSDSRWVYLRL